MVIKSFDYLSNTFLWNFFNSRMRIFIRLKRNVNISIKTINYNIPDGFKKNYRSVITLTAFVKRVKFAVLLINRPPNISLPNISLTPSKSFLSTSIFLGVHVALSFPVSLIQSISMFILICTLLVQYLDTSIFKNFTIPLTYTLCKVMYWDM